MNLTATLLVIHVISGFTALFVGLVPMFSKKGSKLHNNSGWVYFFGMFGVFVTSTFLFLMEPERLLFLMLIGVFSFYMTFSGVRAVQYKKRSTPIANLDWIVAGLVGLAGLVMLGLGINAILQNTQGMGILYLVFGTVCLLNGGTDLQYFQGRRMGTAPLKRFWLHHHAVRMGGSYIATLTAFCVTNINFLPPLVVWLAPGVIGGIILNRVARKLKKQNKQLASK